MKKPIKKYQSGGNVSKAQPKNFKNAQDSVKTARGISQRLRDYSIAAEKGLSPAENSAAVKRLGQYLDSTDFKNRFSPEHKGHIIDRALERHGALLDQFDPAEKYKSGGTIKKQTMKNKPAPKKKMSAKEMEAMKKAKTPIMKYGGKMGKKPC